MHRRDFIIGVGAASASLAAGAAEAADIAKKAAALHRRAIVIDANLSPPGFDTDALPLPKDVVASVRAAGVTTMKTTLGGFGGSFEDTLGDIAAFQRLIEGDPVFRQIRSVADIHAAKRAGQTGIIFSFESATCLEDKLERIELFRGLGVRVMQLSYNLTSPFGAGVLAPPEAGLTELGRKAIDRMNALGVALDLSHANPATTAAALEASKKPALITHAGCAAVHANPRNKTDAQLRAIADKGGVVGIFDLFYLSPPPRQPTLDDYLAHLTHALDVCGEDHVGIGSDAGLESFAAAPGAKEAWLKEAERRRAAGVAAPEEDGRFPYTEGLDGPDRTQVIAESLLKRGYSERAVEKILGANFLRAFGEIWG